MDTQPHPGATGSAMLGNLANMAAREVDAPYAHQQIPREFYNNGCSVGPLYRKLIDDYIWVTILLDTTKPRWPIQHVNAAFYGMTGKGLPLYYQIPCNAVLRVLGHRASVSAKDVALKID